MLSSLTTWNDRRAREALNRMFLAAIASADPTKVLPAQLPEPPKGRCVVVGAGKAAASMAAAVEGAWADARLSGVCVAPYGYGGSTARIAVREAAHPVPDAASENAAREILSAVQGLGPDDLVLALISGGGSSVLSLPAEGITLAEKQTVNRALLASGLDIRTMNAVRRRLSAIKGGRLAAAASPARVVTLAISDIPGDDPGAIASGPTVEDVHGDIDLSDAIVRLAPSVSAAVIERLRRPYRPVKVERAEFRMIATPAMALAAAGDVAQTLGLDIVHLGDDVEGESRVVGAQMARQALEPCRRPTVLLSGGETTVTITGGRAGRGGRNTEFLLSAANTLRGAPGVWGLAGDTDGEDGASGGGAGAILAPDTLRRAAALGLDAGDYLANHDSGSFFQAIGDLLITGPTRTNVNDFRAILVTPI